jgi:beta-lactamase superfamily II metal-dependent hydrolase
MPSIALRALLTFFLAAVLSGALTAPNGKLLIRFMDVRQGESAVMILPQGEIVMFDNGNSKACDKPLPYLEQLGSTQVDYPVTSHYQSEHIGCTPEVFSPIKLKVAAYDRGRGYTMQQYKAYVKTFGNKRIEAHPGDVITIDKKSQHPVTIEFVAADANGINTSNENDRSTASLVAFGSGQ